MRKLRNFAIFLLSFSFTLVVCVCLLYNYMLSSVSSKSKKEVLFEIKSGDTSKEIARSLYEKKLIRSDKVFLVYLKINNVKDIKAGYFNLSKSMNIEEIVSTLRENSNINPNNINILFNEGLTMRGIATIINEETNNSYESLFELLDNEEYINELINKYWFLSDDIKNENIYYKLEGYLYPDTYKLTNKDVTNKEIIEEMLNKEDEILSKYRDEIEKSNYSIHQILTLASIVESEGISYEDRRNICSVFNNRLNKKMSLGSDVTTYYAFKVDMNERDLKLSEINTSNPYNTRGPNMEGKLPVGPVCNPSEQSIKAVLNATDTDYLFFVADKNRKVYFTKTVKEHDQIIAKLKNEGLWYEW